MKRRYSTIFFILFLYVVLRPHCVHAQIETEVPDSLLAKITYYGIKESPSVLFAHFDKTIYVNNENVWFTAYLLNYNKKKDNPTFLSVLLVNDQKKTISVEQRFPMADGLSFGNVLIPDTIPPGDYSFILYTNELRNGKPADTFTQHITIKATSKPAISATLALDDTSRSGYYQVKVKVADKDGRPLPGAEVGYHIGKLSGKTKTDQYGKSELSFPVGQILAGSDILSADIGYKKDISSAQLVIRVTKNKFNLKFYPEGGSLVHATQSIIGWEVKDTYGMPVRLDAVLYKDKHAIDTLHTNSYGMGRFKLIPLQSSKYEVKLVSLSDSIYKLPNILGKGPVITVNKAIANDSLHVRLVSKYGGKYYLFIHNYRQAFFYIPVEIGAPGKNVLINLVDVPKGLTTITVLDSLQRPCAERIFFAHYDRRAETEIAIDKSEYTTRQKVKLTLKLKSSSLDTVKGLVSIACVQSNRMDIKKANDIESYVYLRSELENMPIKENCMGRKPADMDYLENVLLIKGWRKYKWQEMEQVTVKDTNIKVDKMRFQGTVNYYGKKIKRVENVMVVTDSTTNIITTNSSGEFELDNNSITTEPGKKVNLLLRFNQKGYSIKLNSFNNINEKLIEEFKSVSNNFLRREEPDLPILEGLEHTINLKEVKITSKKDNEPFLSSAISLGDMENQCGDYVCRYDILNCPNHNKEPDNRAPVIGQTYSLIGGGWTTYKGCAIILKSSMLKINGITYSKEFYGEDYSVINPLQPEYQSTIYWKRACFINSKGETRLSFYTSDITGPFKIIIQGITDNDVIYGEKEFNIKKP